MENDLSEIKYGPKTPLWQLILIYLILAIFIYALIYYSFLAKRGGYQKPQQPYQLQPTVTPNSTESIAPISVQISNFSFYPNSLTIRANQSVTWINNDSVSHSVAADDDSFTTGIIPPGKSVTINFSKVGTYSYYCTIHPTMKGTIVVTQ